MKVEIHKQVDDSHLVSSSLKNLVEWICRELNLPIVSLDIIFTDDNSLRSMHKQYLDDDTYTDVMVFNLGNDDKIEGEIYISIDRARENAGSFHTTFEDEINRLIIHACLHLAGYQDKNENLRKIMKEKEDDLLEIASKEIFN